MEAGAGSSLQKSSPNGALVQQYAEDPAWISGADRCLHWTVKIALRLLLNCAAVPNAHADNIAANALPRVFGYIRAYFGIVEPQEKESCKLPRLSAACPC